MTKEEYMRLPKERLAELLVERDSLEETIEDKIAELFNKPPFQISPQPNYPYQPISVLYGCPADLDFPNITYGIDSITEYNQGVQKPVEQDTETYDLWVYIREWNDKFGRLPKDEDELADCIDYVMKRQKPADKYEPMSLDEAIEHCKGKSCGNNACALEHQQLANWLIELKELKEQKPAEWREEDENILNDIIVFTSGYADKRVVKEWVSFLKSLTPRQRQEWSEEDMKQIRQIERIVKDSGASIILQKKISDWLKSIKDRVQPQPKQEWNKEDESCIRNLESLLYYDKSLPEDTRTKLGDFLNSLKPQQNLYDKGYEDGYSAAKYNHWKPSEEQMKTSSFYNRYDSDELYSRY